MSKAICVMGESGSGKTSAMRNLNPEKTYYIDCDRKGLAWKGWRDGYNTERKNFLASRDLSKIASVMQGVSDKRPEIKVLVIDTLNTAMVDKEIKGLGDDSGYGKWIDLTQFVWQICTLASALREDLTVIVVMHAETVRDDFGYTLTRIKTNGRKLEKVVLESLFSTVLLARRKENGSYILETASRQSTAKAPLGAFENGEIENDITLVLAALEEY